jgi:hypothetical protein
MHVKCQVHEFIQFVNFLIIVCQLYGFHFY